MYKFALKIKFEIIHFYENKIQNGSIIPDFIEERLTEGHTPIEIFERDNVIYVLRIYKEDNDKFVIWSPLENYNMNHVMTASSVVSKVIKPILKFNLRNNNFRDFLEDNLIQVIKTLKHIPWDAIGLALNPIVTVRSLSKLKMLSDKSSVLLAKKNVSETENNVYQCFNIDVILINILIKKSWDWKMATNLTDATTINDYSFLPWDWKIISSRMDIGLIIEKNPFKPYDTRLLSNNSSICLDFICKNPGINWNMNYLSMNKNITMSFIEEHPDWNWNYYMISNNPNLNTKMILCNLDKNLSWYACSVNINPDYEHCARKWMAAHTLQNKMYNKSAYDPRYKFCIKRLHRIHNELVDEEFT
jgi:hypothetical protein